MTVQATAGRWHLMIYQPGKSPVPLVNTTEETSTPVAEVGDEVLFMMPPRTLATASVAQGRITHQIAFDRGSVIGLALSPDGATIYCAAAGFVWAQPVAGGEARRIRAGNSVAVDPSGKLLLVSSVQGNRLNLYRVPLDGSPESVVPLRRRASGLADLCWFAG